VADALTISAEQVALLLDVSRALALVMDLDALLPQMARAACQVLDCTRASLWLHDADRRVLYTKVILDADPVEVPDTSGIVGAAFGGNAVLNIPNPYDDPRFNQAVDRRTGLRTETILAAPLVDLTGRPVGVVQAVNKAAGGPFSAVDEALLRWLADQAAVAVQRHRLHEAAIAAAQQSATFRHELELAQAVQRALVPEVPPVLPGLSAAGWTRPASIAGGDCYDLWPLPDGRLAILIADASGHGIAPAMIVSQTRTMARLLCESPDAGCALPTDPADVLRRIGRRLSADLDPAQFVTAALAFVDPVTGAVAYASAGHGPTFVQPHPGGPAHEVDSSGLPLGVMADCFGLNDTAPTRTLHLAPGGRLLLLTDGVFEAFDPLGRPFGTAPVASLLQGENAEPAGLIDSIRQPLDHWLGNGAAQDDQTVVVVQRALTTV
jgi:phosphoserine phosphatase